jgi:hypothetical protein
MGPITPYTANHIPSSTPVECLGSSEEGKQIIDDMCIIVDDIMLMVNGILTTSPSQKCINIAGKEKIETQNLLFETIDKQKDHYQYLIEDISFLKICRSPPNNEKGNLFTVEQRILYNVVHSIRHKIGNCQEYALLTGTLLHILLRRRLTEMGHTASSIESLQLKIQFLYLDKTTGGDHAIIGLTFHHNNNDIIYMIDALFNERMLVKDAFDCYRQYSGASIFIPGDLTFFDLETNSEFMNNPELLNSVIEEMNIVHGIDLNIYNGNNPFKEIYSASGDRIMEELSKYNLDVMIN